MTGFSLAAFASLRLGENRRLNKEAHLWQRRKGAAIYFSKTINAILNSSCRNSVLAMKAPWPSP
jgi:hypothetical protein